MTTKQGAAVESIPQIDMILCKYPHQKFDVDAWKEEHRKRMELSVCRDSEDRTRCVESLMVQFEKEIDEGNPPFNSRAGFLQQIEECKKSDEAGVIERTNHTITPEERERGAPWVFAMEYNSYIDAEGVRAGFSGRYLDGGLS